MAGRGRTSFQKRQKEQLRLERRQMKAARKDARKAAKALSPDGTVVDEEQELDQDLDSDMGEQEDRPEAE